VTIVIAVDPGTTTGIAVYDGRLCVVEEQKQFNDVLAVSYVWDAGDDLEVACERYDITPSTSRMTRNMDPIHVTGAMRYHCTMRGIPFRLYGRSDAKNFARDQKLRDLDLWRPGMIHAMDATRVLLLHLATTDPDSYLRLVNGTR
jgi:hypothetical protein